MRPIGRTNDGGYLVELSQQEYEALVQVISQDRPETPENVVEQFLDYVHGQGKSRSTVEAYKHGLTALTTWLGRPVVLSEITPRVLADWKAHQQTVEQAAPATINLRMTAVSQLFVWAIGEGLVSVNPTAKIKQLAKARLQPHSLAEAEVQRLLEAVRATGDLRNIAIVELMLGTGLRVSEVLALRRGDVGGGRVVVRSGKGGKFREVPLPSDAARAVEIYLAGRDIRARDGLWQGQRGDLVSSGSIGKMLKGLAEAAGIEEIYPHKLRHTYARRYLDANPADIRGLASLMGHSSINTTMVYTEPSQSDLAARVERAAKNG